MVNENFFEGDEGREKLFRKVVERYVQYVVWVVDVQGVDCYFFGLKKFIVFGELIFEIFFDFVFVCFFYWELFIFNFGLCYFDGWGYGEVVEDGFGLSYSIEDDVLRWGIIKKKGLSGVGVSVVELGQVLEFVVREVVLMMERVKIVKINV